MDNDSLLYFGGEVKALDDNGRVGGYLVRFTDAKHKDLTGEYFTSKTYLGPQDGNGSETLFDHGYPIKSGLEELADYTFQPLKTKRDKVGIWAETVLNISDEYEKMVFGLVKKGKLGWSSGAAGHRVKKNPDGEITAWPIAEGSITPRPAEPLNRVMTMKSLADVEFVDMAEDKLTPLPALGTLAAKLTAYIADQVEDGYSREELVKRLAREAMIDVAEVEQVLSGEVKRPTNARLKAFSRVLNIPFNTLKQLATRSAPKSIKDLFTDEFANRTPSVWDMNSSYSCVARKVAEAAKGNKETGTEYDYESKIAEATAAYMDLLQNTVVAQIRNYVEGESGEDEFYLKHGLVANGLLVTSGTDFDTHSELVVTAFRELAQRFRDNHELRKSQKAGRVLSEKNRQRLVKFLDQIMTAVTDCQSLLEETKPMASDTEKRAALTHHLRLRFERRQQIGA